MTLGQRIRTGVGWLMFGSTGGHALEFLFGIALARLLVPADFGMMATIHILTGVVSLVSSGGMGQSLIRARQADETDFNVIFTIQLGLGVLICGGIFLIAPWFAKFFGNPLYKELLAISGLTFLLRPFAMIRTAWLNREMEFKGMSVISVTNGVLIGLVSVGMATAGFGVWSLALSGLLGAMAKNIQLYRLTPLRLRLRFNWQVARQHARFGFNITVLDLLSRVRDEGLNLILSKLAGPAFLGLFKKAESMSRMPNRAITPATGKVVFRALSTVSDDLDQSKYIMHRTITLLSVYVFPLLVGLIWVAEPLIGFLYGEKWLPAAEPLRILAFGSFLLIILRPCSVLLEAQNRLGQEIIVVAVSVVVVLIGAYVGLRWGLVGVAYAIVFSHVLSVVMTYALVRRVLRTTVGALGRALVPALMLNSLLMAALAAVHWQVAHLRIASPFLYLAVMGGIGALVYGAAFLLLPVRGLETEVSRWRGKISKVFEKLKLPWR